MARRSRGKRLAELAGAHALEQPSARSSSPTLTEPIDRERCSHGEKNKATPSRRDLPRPRSSSRKKRRTEDGLVRDSSHQTQAPPRSREASSEAGRSDGDVLVGLFTSLGAALLLFRRRRRTPFFSRIQRAVESSGAKRRLDIDHVAKILTVYPGAFTIFVKRTVEEDGDVREQETGRRRYEYVVGLPQDLVKSCESLQTYLPPGAQPSLGAIMDARVKYFVDLLDSLLVRKALKTSAQIPSAALPDLRVKESQRGSKCLLQVEVSKVVENGTAFECHQEKENQHGLDGVLQRVRAREEKKRLEGTGAEAKQRLEQRRLSLVLPALADATRSWCLQHQRKAVRLEELAEELSKTCAQSWRRANPSACSWEEQQSGSKRRVIRALRIMSELVPGWMSFSKEASSTTTLCVRFNFSLDFGLVKERLKRAAERTRSPSCSSAESQQEDA